MSTLSQYTPNLPHSRPPAAHTLLAVARLALADKKAAEIVSVPLPADALADNLLICTATSSRHAAALVDHVAEALREAGEPVLSIDGKNESDWLVVDAGDFIVHVMTEEARKTYNLEKLWTPMFENEDDHTDDDGERQAG